MHILPRCRTESGLANLIRGAGVFACLFSFAVSLEARADLALVYKGPGSCDEQCSEAAANVAELAGFKVEFVGPDSTDESLFKDAKIWLQPGGEAGTAMDVMNAGLKTRIRNLVSQGGGYVGFCAGAFTATAKVGRTRVDGLGILPGLTRLYKHAKPDNILKFLWEGAQRYIYWEGGPYFVYPQNSGIEKMATYPDGTTAAVRAPFGKGRVFVTGAHPEAPPEWLVSPPLVDPDGQDYALAVEMVRWAASQQ